MIDAARSDLAANAGNRLSIGFLFTWTLCTAISLAIDRWDFAVHSDVSPDELAYWTAYAFAFRPLNGICLAFLLVVVKRIALRQERLHRAPGHWYLLSMAVLLLILGTGDALRLAAPALSENWSSGIQYSLWMSLAYGLPIVTALLGAICIHHHIWWRMTLVSLSFHWSLVILRYWNVILTPITDVCGLHIDLFGIALGSLPATLSLAAMYQDWRSRRRHDFYHWIGTCVLWATTLLSWPSLFWYSAIYG